MSNLKFLEEQLKEKYINKDCLDDFLNIEIVGQIKSGSEIKINKHIYDYLVFKNLYYSEQQLSFWVCQLNSTSVEEIELIYSDYEILKLANKKSIYWNDLSAFKDFLKLVDKIRARELCKGITDQELIDYLKLKCDSNISMRELLERMSMNVNRGIYWQNPKYR